MRFTNTGRCEKNNICSHILVLLLQWGAAGDQNHVVNKLGAVPKK